MSKTTRLFEVRCEEKYFQLEELEDKDTCTTELLLKTDRTVEFGPTDGPLFTAAVGSWQVVPGTNDFTMSITRSFATGSSGREMGEFSYDLERRFGGEITMVGASAAITGMVFHKAGELSQEIESGYFNMIDATVERLGHDIDDIEE